MTCPQRSWEAILRGCRRGCRLQSRGRGGNRGGSHRYTLGHWFFTATLFISFDSSLLFKPENDLDLGRAAPTCGTKFGREIGATGTLPLVDCSCTPASVAADRRGSLSAEVLFGSALGFGLVSFALLGGGTPRRGPTAAEAAELLRTGAETVAARMGGTSATDGATVMPG